MSIQLGESYKYSEYCFNKCTLYYSGYKAVASGIVCIHDDWRCLHDKGEKLFVNSYWLGYFSVQGDSPIKTLYELLIKIFS